jgi:hypothetical protein
VPPDQLRPLLGRRGGSGSPRTFEFLVSASSDTDHLRDLADASIRRFQQVLRTELRLPIFFESWDYREATPTVVPRGALAATSLATVDRSSAVIPIFGRRLGRIASQEISRAFDRRQRGEDIQVVAFVHPDQRTARQREFFNGITETYGEEIVFAEYHDRLEFQGRFDAWLFRYLFERLTTANPELLSGAAA